MNPPIRFFDMFSGVGGFRAGLERAGGQGAATAYECVGHCEIDKHADRAYRSLFDIKESEVYCEDATKINPNTLPEFDLLTAGFPCQSFSIAGKRQGFLDPRGTLFFEIARLVRARQPAYLLLENVPYALQRIRDIMSSKQLCIHLHKKQRSKHLCACFAVHNNYSFLRFAKIR